MRQIIKTSRFTRDLKKAVKKKRDIEGLKTVISLLQSNGTLPRRYRPHKLAGEWRDYLECHIGADFLLIYQVTSDELALIRLGSHDELF